MPEEIFAVESIGKILGGVVSGGGITSALDVTKYALQLILRLTEDDPVKRQKALREYEIGLMALIREVKDGTDVTPIISAFAELLRDK